MLARVSHIEAFRQWRDDESATAEDLVERLNAPATESMAAGTAFHRALELAEDGEYETLQANGFTFHVDADIDLQLPSIRELRASRHYGELEITGCVDATVGRRIDDHKTTGSFDPDRYLDGCSWKFYLDIFGADIFRWNVFVIRAHRSKARTYDVVDQHTLEQFRYPGLHEDCAALAHAYFETAVALSIPSYQFAEAA